MIGELVLRDLRAGYDGIPVVDGISLTVPAGGFGVVLGANGAGKTTTLRAVMGLAQVLGGTVELGGAALTGQSPARVVGRGVAMVPEGRQLFAGLTVEENLRVGSLVRGGGRRESAAMARVFEYFPVLEERTHQTAGTLSGGEQQMLAIGRALMSDPVLLLVDEASLGLAPLVVERVFELLSRINQDGITVVAVEQNVAVIDHADVVFVLEKGRVELGGTVGEVGGRLRREVTAAYLGREEG